MRLPCVVHHGNGRSLMRVQRVLMPGSRVESWSVLGDDHVPVDPVERFLAYLASIERSPNTVKAYAHDLKDWFTFLGIRGLDWRSVTLEVCCVCLRVSLIGFDQTTFDGFSIRCRRIWLCPRTSRIRCRRSVVRNGS